MLKGFYDKIITGCCFMFIFVNIGLVATTFSVYQPYIVAIDGIGDTGGALILSVRTFVSLISMLVVDKYYKLFNLRVGATLACCFTAAGFIVDSFATSLPVFFCGGFLLGIGYGFGGMVAMTYLANRWFATGIGKMLGFAAMGSGLASIIMPLIIVGLINAFSLSGAFFIEGLIALGIAGLVFLFLRNRPADLGIKPFEKKEGKKRKRRTMRAASKKSLFLLYGAMVCVGHFSCCGTAYLSVLASSSGFDLIFSASLVSMAGIALTLSKFVTGELFDLLGAPKASAIIFAFALVGYTFCSLAFLQNEIIMSIGAIALGAGIAIGSVGTTAWSIELSTPENRVRVIKYFQFSFSLGGFFANTFPGIIKDMTGSYAVSYGATSLIVLLAAIIILRHYKNHQVVKSD